MAFRFLRKLSESGFAGLEDFQDFSNPVNPSIPEILIQTKRSSNGTEERHGVADGLH